MKICVLGAGVVGLTTAWKLAEAGHQVEIVDAHPAPGMETSFANGAQLSYAFVAPFASPTMLKKIPSAVFGGDPAVRVKPKVDFDFIVWGFKFALACTEEKYGRATERLLQLAALSREEMALLTAKLKLEFGYRAAGKLLLYREKSEFHAAQSNNSLFRRLGIERSTLTPQECLKLEPALRVAPRDIVGGIFTASEELGDCAEFCVQLYRHLRQRPNVVFRFGTQILTPHVSGTETKFISTNDGELYADVFVLSMGISSVGFARQSGFYLSLYPLKGYSVTLNSTVESPPLSCSVTDISRKIVFAPLKKAGLDVVRVAGIADLVGNDRTIDGSRVKLLRDAATETVSVDTVDAMPPWAGLRPATPDGLPVIGWSPIRNLFINTGHGGFGWTLACGSARIAADAISSGHPASS